MKLFFTGFAVAAIGLSGIANILDFGLNIIKNHAQRLNTELQEVGYRQ
jgi:hypothetical protein